MKIGQQQQGEQISLHQHSEKEIDSKYINEEDGEKLCYITNFEFRDVSTNLFKSPESLADGGVRLVLSGCLLTPEQAELYYSSASSSSSLKHSNDGVVGKNKRVIQNEGKNADDEISNYRVAITNLTQWVFDHGTELQTKGVWVQTKKIWYKLIKPSEYFRLVYEPFERKSNIWLELRPILLKWMKMFDKCSDDRVDSVLETMDLELVMKTMGQMGYTESEIIENAEFIYDKAVQDLDAFSLEDDPDVNQVLRTKFIQELFPKSSKSSKSSSKSKVSSKASLKLDLNADYSPQPAPSTKSSTRVKKYDLSDSSASEYPAVEIEDPSSESSSSEEEYILKEEKLSEEEYHSLEEEEEYLEEEEDNINNKKRKTHVKNQKKKRMKKTLPEEDPEEKPKSTKSGRRKSDVHVTTYNLEPGVPSAEELLSQEFTPRLFTKLSTKYDVGVVPSMCTACRDDRINCFKERPICSHCLEKGIPCIYPKFLRLAPCVPCTQHRSKVCNRQKPSCNRCAKGECFYFTSDTGLIIGDMKIRAAKELYANLDAKELEEPKENEQMSVSQTFEGSDSEDNDESSMLEIEENKKNALKLKEQIHKWKKIVQEEKELNNKKLNQLNYIISEFK